MLSFDHYGVQFGLPVPNRELHGKEVVPYVAVPTEAVVNAANLESFKAGLQDALWKRPAINDSERLDDDGKVHDLVCRFPTAKPLPFADRYPGYSLTLLKTELYDDESEWPIVELTSISVQPENGGTARIRFKMLIRGDEAVSFWPGMMFRSAQITLMPPKPDALPSGHPDAREPDDPLSGSLEFGRDAQREGDSGDADPDDSDNAGAPEGLDAARLAEAERDAVESAARKASTKRGKRTNGATAGVH